MCKDGYTCTTDFRCVRSPDGGSDSAPALDGPETNGKQDGAGLEPDGARLEDVGAADKALPDAAPMDLPVGAPTDVPLSGTGGAIGTNAPDAALDGGSGRMDGPPSGAGGITPDMGGSLGGSGGSTGSGLGGASGQGGSGPGTGIAGSGGGTGGHAGTGGTTVLTGGASGSGGSGLGGTTSAGGTAGGSSGGAGSGGTTGVTCTGSTKLCNGTCIATTSCCGGCSGNTPVCSNGTCVAKTIGDNCGTGTECGSGVCADGVCCDVQCNGQCESCALTGKKGTCSPATTPRTPCTGSSTGICAGACDGTPANRKQCVYPPNTTSCGTSSCSETRIIQGGHCASGSCAPDGPQDCNGGLICSGSACKISCVLDTDCRSDYFCSAAACHSDATAVSSYGGHVCVLAADHTIHCWGNNDQGQLGDGTVTASWTTTPATVSGITNATAIYAGGGFSCALLSDATVRCWGTNMHGELGIGDSSTTYRSTPVTPAGLSSVIALAVSSATACALEQAGTLKCWGYNGGGGVVLGSTNFYEYSPLAIPGITGAKAIAIGGTHGCVLVSDGTPKCWGQNGFLAAGAPESMFSVDTPRTADGTGPGFTGITAGHNHTCVLKNGTATCWGENRLGQLGNSTVLDPQPAQVLNMISGISILSAGDTSTCALLTNGNVWCWGSVMSTESTTPTVYPVQVNLTGAKNIVGGSHSCAILGSGSVSCWGWGSDHYLPSSPVAAVGW
jgi:alpha-tubulin suppressor-like RCC1 family protein